jgi:hypothetical protein
VTVIVDLNIALTILHVNLLKLSLQMNFLSDVFMYLLILFQPKTKIGELRITFRFGHMKNGQLDLTKS